MEALIKVCEEAARAGGDVLRRSLGKFRPREKAPADLVTEADLQSQEAIRRRIHAAFPDHQFLAEEQPQHDWAAAAGYRWIVDPLDGTTNFVHQVPQFGVSVAVEHRGTLLAGVVLDPMADECFTATAGGGAYCNGRRLHVSDVVHLREALVAVSFSAGVQRGSPEIDNFVNVLVACQAVRRTGSAALNLAYVAAGRFDGYFATSTSPWDVAAGFLLVQEAHGCLTALDGSPGSPFRRGFVAASTPQLCAQLRPLLKPPVGSPLPH
jgi:myo-inositol-1(or 4)-monophosphatase